jgi:threonine dehydratase
VLETVKAKLGNTSKDSEADRIPQLADICAALERIRPYVRHTPVLPCDALNEQFGAEFFLKCENLQVTGSFKVRGACNSVVSLPQEVAERGIVTHSSGNHAAAVAWAGRLRGIPVSIVMPENSRPNKLQAVRRLGVEPTLCGPTAESRQAAAQTIIDRTGSVLIHPYDAFGTIAGQGTAALELIEQVPDLDIVIVPVGGGGMLSGTLLVLKELLPNVRVIAAEPAWADDAYRSLKSGQRQMPKRTDTMADGLRTPLGELNYSIIREHIDDILLASEETIASATRQILEDAKTVVEPSGALPLAVLLDNDIELRGKRIAMMLTGGNLDLDQLPWSETDQ